MLVTRTPKKQISYYQVLIKSYFWVCNYVTTYQVWTKSLHLMFFYQQ